MRNPRLACMLAVLIASTVGACAQTSVDGSEGGADAGGEAAGELSADRPFGDLEVWDSAAAEGVAPPELSAEAHLEASSNADSAADAFTPDGLPELAGCAAPTVRVTVNRIPESMNGSKPYLNNQDELVPFHLAVPDHGFVWNVAIQCPCGCQPEAIAAFADVQVGPVAAGENLFSLFLEDPKAEDGSQAWAWRVDVAHAFDAAQEVVLFAEVVDLAGKSAAGSLTVQTVVAADTLLPFDLPDPWLLLYRRDHYTISLAVDAEQEAVVESVAGANGQWDFLEDLWLVGLGSASPTAEFAAMGCGEVEGGPECLARQLLQRVREKIYEPFGCGPDGVPGPDGIPLVLYLEGEPGAPDPATFSYETLTGGESTRAFSILGLGGGDLAESWVGMSESMDLWNNENENNGTMYYGCFTTSLVRFVYEALAENEDLYALAQLALAEILPPMGGVPIGEMPGDHLVADFSLAQEDLPDELQGRRTRLDTMLEILALGLGALAAHEMGHSLGLVPSGAPPHGLFAGEQKAEFIASAAGSVGPHIDTAGLNLMQAGPGSGNGLKLGPEYLTSKFFFNELNLAYLQGRLIVLPK